MTTTEEKLTWALGFVQANVATFRQGDWLNLEEDMRAFLGGNASAASQVHNGGILTAVQSKAFLILSTLAEQSSPAWVRLTRKPGWQQHLTIDARSSQRVENSGTVAEGSTEQARLILDPRTLEGLVFDLSAPGQYRLSVLASQLQPAFEFALGVTLAGVDVSRIRCCFAPRPRQDAPCGVLFFAHHKRQEFCSIQCKNRAALQRFRRGHQEQEAERGRANYAQKMKKKLGPGVKITRRTRTPKTKES